MIHYHGTRIACSDDQAARILKGRHAFVSYADTSQLSIVEEVCQSYALDNGAYSFFNSGKKVDWDDFYKFVEEVRSPSMDFFIIPDVIDGTEEENDELIRQCPLQYGVPVWHTGESLKRLEMLRDNFPLICIGSGKGLEPNTHDWWIRMNQALEILSDENGKPKTYIHGLRMLNPEIFTRIPFKSADSTNVGRNLDDKTTKWTGTYKPLSIFAKAMVLIDRIETFNSPPRWEKQSVQGELWSQNI